MTRVPANKRRVNTVFQNYALFPHLDVFENIAFGLRARKFAVDEVDRRVRQALEMLHLEEMPRRRTSQLSGGQKQRVALARALVHEPRLIVCDEPTSALDAETGHAVMELLTKVAVRHDRAVIVVTHDSRVFEFGDRIAHMDDGRIVDTEVPQDARYRAALN